MPSWGAAGLSVAFQQIREKFKDGGGVFKGALADAEMPPRGGLPELFSLTEAPQAFLERAGFPAQGAEALNGFLRGTDTRASTGSVSLYLWFLPFPLRRVESLRCAAGGVAIVGSHHELEFHAGSVHFASARERISVCKPVSLC